MHELAIDIQCGIESPIWNYTYVISMHVRGLLTQHLGRHMPEGSGAWRPTLVPPPSESAPTAADPARYGDTNMCSGQTVDQIFTLSARDAERGHRGATEFTGWSLTTKLSVPLLTVGLWKTHPSASLKKIAVPAHSQSSTAGRHGAVTRCPQAPLPQPGTIRFVHISAERSPQRPVDGDSQHGTPTRVETSLVRRGGEPRSWVRAAQRCERHNILSGQDVLE